MCKDPRQDSGQKNISYSRYPEKCFHKINRDLYGDAMLVPIRMSTYTTSYIISSRFSCTFDVLLFVDCASKHDPNTAGPNHPPKGLLRLNLRIFYISFHFSTKLAR